jgi:FdhD protein
MSLALQINNSCAAAVKTLNVVARSRNARPPEQIADAVAVEEPLEIRVNGRPVSVTMRTPGHDDELAAGFLLSEDLLHERSDLAGFNRPKKSGHSLRGSNWINARLAAGVQFDFARLTRHVFASSSCGLCGKATIASIQQKHPPLSAGLDTTVRAEVLRALPDLLRGRQATFDRTGGLHAAALFNRNGKLLALREDVGRHNAVDKVLGAQWLKRRWPLTDTILLVSGRASFEILQKSLVARVPVVAAVSAPSSLAVDFAERSGQTLVGFLRGDGMNIYTHPHRIGWGNTLPSDLMAL